MHNISTIIFGKSQRFLLSKYIQGDDMFRLYRAIIRPYLKNRSISLRYYVCIAYVITTPSM